MTGHPFVPDGFVPPRELSRQGFRLEPLGPRHNASDHDAWTSSIDYIRATPDFQGRSWPPAEGMSLEANLGDLERHAADFEERKGFTFTVLEDGDGDLEDNHADNRVIGCVYIYPDREQPAVARVRSWVRADRAELDGPVADAVAAWLASDWPFPEVRYR